MGQGVSDNYCNLTRQKKTQSSKGSAWIDLSFSLRKNKAQAIDEYGMTKLAKVSTIKDPKIADYLFTITKKKGKILLTRKDEKK